MKDLKEEGAAGFVLLSPSKEWCIHRAKHLAFAVSLGINASHEQNAEARKMSLCPKNVEGLMCES